MKALSIKQPWLDAIVQPSVTPKWIENRSRPAPAKHIGTRILLHASAQTDRHAILPFGYNTARRDWPDVRGAILAVATLAGCHFDRDGCGANCATWGEWQVYHWLLADVVALPEPVPAKGALGFWRPTPAVLDAVQRQIEVTA